MDANRFDALAKQVSTRRIALGGLLVGVLFPLQAAARGKGRDKAEDKDKDKGAKPRKHKGKDRATTKGGNKNKNKDKNKGKNKQRVNAQEVCWRAGACIPKKGANVSRCDLAGYTAPSNFDCTGCNLSRANLRGANLSGATFTRANLSGACLIDAEFTNATFANSTNLANAIFCNTTMPDGSVNNSGCGNGTGCCDTCVPATCQSLGKSCGAWPDGCGETLSCGSCAAGTICDDGTCQTCDVTCSGTPEACGTALQAAVNAPGPDATVYVCPGIYRGGFTLSTAVTVVGAGQGDNPAVDTILNGNKAAKVLVTGSGSATLRQVRITAGRTNDINGGAGVYHLGPLLTMTDCTVIDNHTNASSGSVVRGAISTGALGRLEMTRCTIRDNSVTNGAANGRALGAGMYDAGQSVLTDCVIRNNTANSDESNGAGIFKIGKTLQLTRCRITENTLTQPANPAAGGLFGFSATATMTDSYIWNNTAPDCGGSISGSGCGTAPPS